MERILAEMVVKHSGETARQRLIRACVAFWESDDSPISGVTKKTGEFWQMPKSEYLELWDKELAKIRENQKDKFSTAYKGSEMRSVGMLPQSLFEFVEEVFKIYEDNPELKDEGRPFSQDKELNWFYRSFPRYKIAEKL